MRASKILSLKAAGWELPVVALPMPWENIQGFILRLSEMNHYERPYWIYSMFNPDKAGLGYAAFRKCVEALPKLTGIKASIIRNITYLSEDESNHNKIHLGQRGIIPAALLDIHNPKVCVGCLKEFGTTSALWDLKYYQACSRHRCDLVDQCTNPKCHTKITWWRPEIKKCSSCKQAFELPETASVPNETLLKFSSFLEKQWGVPFEVELSPDVMRFPSTEFSEFHRLLQLLKRTMSGKKKTQYPKPLYDKTSATRAIANIVADWPMGYHRFLEGLISTDMMDRQGSLIASRNLFGRFSNRVMEGGDQSYFEPLQAEMSAFLYASRFSLHITGKGGSRLAVSQGSKNKYLNRTEVMNELSISAATFRRLFAKGDLTGEKLHMGKQYVYRVDRDSVEKYKREFR